MHALLMAIALLPVKTQSAQAAQWAPFAALVGDWTGKSTGEPGVGDEERSYQLVMNGQYLHIRNKAVFPPKPGKDKGEVHEDWGMLSLNKNRGKYILREFHVEGFVNQYVLEPLDRDAKKFIFITESIENIPAGYRARHVLEIISKDELREQFSIAEPNKDFEVYTTAVLHRKSTGK